MSKPCVMLCITLVVGLTVSGCATPQKRELSLSVSDYVTLANGRSPLDPEKFDVDHQDLKSGLIAKLEQRSGHPLHILELSGGGQNGAFGVGFLAGWTERGTRPQFDLVTGVSAGALMATHAFLGSPKDDEVLKEMFTGIDQTEIYVANGFLNITLGWVNSLLDTAPLRALLEKYITQEVLERLAAEYDKGRRLFVGTTNLDYGQLWVWNLTRIAKDGGPGALELYRSILLASASPPLMFPPVEIDGHLFVDGAVRDNVVIAGLVGVGHRHIEDVKDEYAHLAEYDNQGRVYVIMNTKLTLQSIPVQSGLLDLTSRSVNIMMEGENVDSLLINFIVTVVHGYNFNLVSIPLDIDIGDDPLAFNPEYMERAYESGYALAFRPDPWRHLPPVNDEIAPWLLQTLEALSAKQ